MFRRSLKGGLLFSLNKERRADIWTFGMLFSIDILWISSRKKVVKVKENARPFRYASYPKEKAKWILELPAGVVRKTKTRIGDTLHF